MPTADHSADQTTSTRRHGVLVVDDEPEIRDSLKDLLEACVDHVTVHCAASGAEGLRLLEDEAIDLVISDYKMPGMNGLEFLRRAELVAPGVPRVLATAFPDLGVEARAVNEAHVEGFIIKPFEPQIIIEVVERALGERRADRQRDLPGADSVEISPSGSAE